MRDCRVVASWRQLGVRRLLAGANGIEDADTRAAGWGGHAEARRLGSDRPEVGDLALTEAAPAQVGLEVGLLRDFTCVQA